MNKEEMSNIIEENKSYLMHFALKRTSYNKEEAEELFQDTALKLLVNSKKFQPKKAKFFTYASKVMTNIAIDNYRKMYNKAHNPNKTLHMDNFLLSNGEDVPMDYFLGASHNEGEFSQDMQYIMDAICKLPKYCQAPLLWRMQGYDYKTMAKGLNIDSKNLRPAVNKARKLLKIELADYLQDKIPKEIAA